MIHLCNPIRYIKITLFKDPVKKIIEVKVSENKIVTWTSIISGIRSLNKVFLCDYDISNRIVQMNGSNSFYSVIII